MWKYIVGFILNFFNPATSLFALVDKDSKVDKKACINRTVKLLKSSVSKYSYIGHYSVIIHCNIGKYCSIGPNCIIGLPRHSLGFLSTSPIFTEPINGTGFQWVNKETHNPYDQTYIGNDVWLGNNVLVKGGVCIGNGAVVGAGAVVTKNIPPYAVVGGVPAKIIKYRYDRETITYLEELKWWNLPEEMLQSNITIFQKVNFTIDDLETLVSKENF